jgi:hypothetical protein
METDIKEKQSKQVLLNNIRCANLSLKQPLSAIIENDGAEVICDCPDIDLYGVGETEQEAITDFSENLEDLFYLLKESGEEKLGPQMIYIWRFLEKIIEETNAVKG